VARALVPSLDWLLVFVPATIALEHLAPHRFVAVFACACLAIVPLAAWLGRATEQLAERTNEGIGGLLNATFGNAAELIIALAALRHGYDAVVKASLTGSIIGNILLVLGAATIAGGVKHRSLRFNVTGARSYATMLTLAAIALVVPAAFHHIVHPRAIVEHELSDEIAVVLLLTYFASLVFSLRTHKHLFTGEAPRDDRGTRREPAWSVRRSVGVLAGATALVAWMSEILVGAIQPTAEALGLTDLFIGVIVVAVVGNAAEHATAVQVAMKNRMDLALGIAIGSSVQIALFVAPVLVLASLVIAPRPMDLVFTSCEVMAIVIAVAVIGQIAGDGESHWLEGVQLLAVYAILAIAFYLVPETVAAPG